MPVKTLRVQNVKCEGCATTLKNKLADEFGKIEVDLTKMPREITLDIEEDRVETLKSALKSLGYPLEDEKLGFFANKSAQAKSFVSCAIGKIEHAQENR